MLIIIELSKTRKERRVIGCMFDRHEKAFKKLNHCKRQYELINGDIIKFVSNGSGDGFRGDVAIGEHAELITCQSEYPIPVWTFDDLEKYLIWLEDEKQREANRADKDKVEVLYLCDKKACYERDGYRTPCYECKHTSDIAHAINFKEHNRLYVEKETQKTTSEDRPVTNVTNITNITTNISLNVGELIELLKQFKEISDKIQSFEFKAGCNGKD